MICSIHQPNYIPYLGLFDKIKMSDIFVFYDTAQYTKGDFHNRNTIKGSNGGILLTLPVKVKLGDKISEVTFDNKVLAKHWQTIQQSYKKAKFFEMYKSEISKIFSYQGNNLSEFNIYTIKLLSELLGIHTKFVVLSDISKNLETKSTDALVDICKIVGANEYISGSGGRNYIQKEKFIDNQIHLIFQDFHHPEYSQLWGDFIPYLSVIDYIFNEGNQLFKSN